MTDHELTELRYVLIAHEREIEYLRGIYAKERRERNRLFVALMRAAAGATTSSRS